MPRLQCTKSCTTKSDAAAFVAQREAAEAMQPGQGAFDNPAEDAEAAAMRTAGFGRALDAAGAMDAENAPTAPWKSLRDFHKRPPPSLLVMTLRTDKRRRACAQLGLT